MWQPILSNLKGVGIVAVSGGADSMALAHYISGWVKKGVVDDVTLVYVDHGLRPDSASDGDFVQDFAKSIGLKCRCQKVVVKKQASLESAARDARYEALEAIRKQENADWIATGHTSTDLAETVLMRMIRGTGPAGLAAMRPQRGCLIRPLLETSRQDTLDYCHSNAIRFLSDPMNDDARFTRVRIRHLWESLEAINPKVEEALCRLAKIAGEERDALDEIANALDLSNTDAVAKIPKAILSKAIQKEADDRKISLEHIHLVEIVKAVQRQEGSRSFDLPGASVSVEYGVIRWPAQKEGEHDSVIAVSGPNPPYITRHWRQGDRMMPTRLMGRSRKLSDLFIDAKIPKRMRHLARVVVRESDGEIVWVEHIGCAYESSVEVSLTPKSTASKNVS